ncbi:hypothetical protein FHX42_000956 [Saccharopolyspora lacisalsi]|uniref:SalK n=1 Tax=Halosaccharopolyspora lacisalsi TaxID=1000566 RepID=A0A839DW10_9PSEU|nr:hypothetical protein [Halosaccharopolyspora lacisalsi]MBA8823627.1 hypothetical protein [Halosaccharopolyspora lacisalsi]
MHSEIARQGLKTLEPLHAMIYFAPETARRFGELGLEPGHMCYFAGRAAPMGAVGPGTVAATFYNYNPDAVAAQIPRAWSLAAPEKVVAARFSAADEALKRLLGEQALSSAEMIEVAQLAREASEGCFPQGRPLYAAHADLEWPEEPHLVLWHAQSMLREFRGDGHIIALQRAGLSGLQALVLNTATGKGFVPSFAKQSRGWSDEQWATAEDELRERGLLDDSGTPTERSATLLEEIETETDELAMAPWRHLGQDKFERLTQQGRVLSKQAVKAGAFPSEFFAAGSPRRAE